MNYDKSTQRVESNKEEAVIYSLSGELVQGSKLESWKEDVGQEIQKGQRIFVVDCGDLYYINSGGLGYLLRVKREVDAAKGFLALVNLQEMVAAVFLNMGLHKVIRYYASIEEALASL